MSNSSVLIIDDTEGNRYRLSRILQRAHYKTFEADSIKTGLDKIKANKPDLIILDVQLPDGNGFDFCMQLKSDPRTSAIPVLLISASFVSDEDKDYGTDSGADSYLTTPVDPMELLATVRALLRLRVAEKKFQIAHEHLHLMIESVKDYAIFSMDLDGCINTWNAGAERMFGYPEIEILGKSGKILFTPEDQKDNIFEMEMWKAAETGRALDERWHMRKDGSRFFSSGIMSAVKDSEGRLLGYTKVARDITANKETEEKLRKSQEVFRTMANSIPAMVWMAGVNQQCYYFNKAWLDFRGKTLEQEFGEGWMDGIYPDDREACIKTYNSAFKVRNPFEITYRLRRHDGKYRWILNRGEPHYGLDGSFSGYTGACIDIHDKLVAEQKLQESKERFALAMQGMNDGLWDYDLAKQKIYYSPRYKMMLGYDDNEYPNSRERWVEDIHPDDREKAIEIAENFIKGLSGGEYRNLFRMRHKDGTYRWILSRGMVVRDDKGRALRFIGGHTDITEQQELQDKLREAYHRAEAANNAKSEFLANMSHEIRTPMNAVIGLANILGTTSLNERQKKFVTTLQLSAESLLNLLNDMLDFTKIEDNMVILENVPFNLPELIEQVVSMFSLKAREKNLGLAVIYLSECFGNYVGDPLRIRQIMINLVSNAVKFTSSGSVKIEIAEKPLAEKDIYELTLSVIDTGIGIPADKLDLIFDKFTQADSSTTRQYGGSGLGLTISKALTEHMGGTITVASQQNTGSIFSVALPLSRAHDAGSVANNKKRGLDIEPKDQMIKGHVLLVEDYRPNIMVATTMLEEFGYSYDVATNGIEALEHLRQKAYHAVLMDVQMQGMDGFEATRRTREWESENRRHPVPIIAMTAHAISGDREKCLAVGMNDYISKPFNPEELRQKLREIMQKAA